MMVRLNLTKRKLRELKVPEDEISDIMSKGVHLAADRDDPRSESKYRSVTCFDEFFETNEAFDSVWERTVWYQRKAEEMGGYIRNLRRQVSYRLVVNGYSICRYVADFVYEERRGEGKLVKWTDVVEDAKGYATREYQIKKRLMQAVLGITIRETRQSER